MQSNFSVLKWTIYCPTALGKSFIHQLLASCFINLGWWFLRFFLRVSYFIVKNPQRLSKQNIGVQDLINWRFSSIYTKLYIMGEVCSFMIDENISRFLSAQGGWNITVVKHTVLHLQILSTNKKKAWLDKPNVFWRRFLMFRHDKNSFLAKMISSISRSCKLARIRWL